jgi:indole-3-glycerol phosphate synthase
MTDSILDEIAEKTRLRVARAKEDKGMGNGEWGMGIEPRKHSHLPEESDCEQEPHSLLPTPYSPTFEQALTTPGLSFICEVKKASPSKGIIVDDFPYLQIAQEYEEAGAAAISVLTEPEYFLGSDLYLWEIAEKVQIPVLRKDFVVDPYQI